MVGSSILYRNGRDWIIEIGQEPSAALSGCARRHTDWVSAAVLMPAQPWGDIRGMGSRLRHACDRISVDVIWNAVCHDLPSLAGDARQAVAQLRAEQDDTS